MTGTDIAIREPQSGTLALTGDQIEWSEVQQAALAHIGIDQAPQADQQVFMHVCQRVRLDPFARQIYMIPRQEGSGQNRKTKWTIQTGIDGFRLIAERHPQYRGQVGPQWCGPDGQWVDVWLDPQKPPVAARVGILRSDRDEPIWGVALFREYAQTTTYDGQRQLTKMWREKGAHMVAKCAEALGLRKAFPAELGGLHTDDEMAGAGALANASAPQPAVRRAATVGELTGAGDVIDVDPEPEPEPDRPVPVEEPEPAQTSAPGKSRDGAGAAPAADPEPPQDPPSPAPSNAPVADQPAQAAPGNGRPAVAAQKKRIGILASEANLDDDGRFAVVAAVIGRTVASTNDLTTREAGAVIDQLEELQRSDDFPAAVEEFLRADEQRRMEAELAAEGEAAS